MVGKPDSLGFTRKTATLNLQLPLGHLPSEYQGNTVLVLNEANKQFSNWTQDGGALRRLSACVWKHTRRALPMRQND